MASSADRAGDGVTEDVRAIEKMRDDLHAIVRRWGHHQRHNNAAARFVACAFCNETKGRRTMEEWGRPLLAPRGTVEAA